MTDPITEFNEAFGYNLNPDDDSRSQQADMIFICNQKNRLELAQRLREFFDRKRAAKERLSLWKAHSKT